MAECLSLCFVDMGVQRRVKLDGITGKPFDRKDQKGYAKEYGNEIQRPPENVFRTDNQMPPSAHFLRVARQRDRRDNKIAVVNSAYIYSSERLKA